MKRLPLSLLAVLIGTLATPLCALAYSITSFENEPVSLKLTDGRRIEGRYRGTVGAATATPYAERYAAWLDEVGPTSAPALGETLLVARASGEALRGAFCGFANGDVLLASGDGCSFMVAHVDGQNVRRVDDPTMESDWIAARDLWKSAPTPYCFVVETDGGTRAVPATVIVSTTSAPVAGGGGGGVAGGVAAGVILGVIVGGLIVYAAIGAAMASAFSHMLI